MSKPYWYRQGRKIHLEFLRRANEVNALMSSQELQRFFALAITGEAGELANLYKKQWRGDKVALKKIVNEMADVRIYLEHLAAELKVDLDDACVDKLNEVEERLKE